MLLQLLFSLRSKLRRASALLLPASALITATSRRLGTNDGVVPYGKP